MPVFSATDLISVLRARSDIYGNPSYSKCVFDTRAISGPKTLFFALGGEQVDGHTFIPSLAGKEGVAAVVKREHVADLSGSIPLFAVDDPLHAAQELAAYVRMQQKNTKFIGVTGSAGKTTAKEFIFQILNHDGSAFRSPGNWNNWVGLPFSLLNMSGNETHAVFELGMSQPGIGEIEVLSNILKPHVAVILNALPVHLEFLKTVDQVAKAKCEILSGLEADGVAFYNIDSLELNHQLALWTGKKRISFSATGPRGDLFFSNKKSDGQGVELRCSYFDRAYSFKTFLTHPAQHNNLLVAIGVALFCEIEEDIIVSAVENLKPVDGRGVMRIISGVTILDETYNSNPEAARLALDWLAGFTGSRVAVLGDMRELGENTELFHRQLGNHAANVGLEQLIAVGEQGRFIAEEAINSGMAKEKVIHFSSAQEAQPLLKKILKPGDVVLFKASRGVGLEKAIPF